MYIISDVQYIKLNYLVQCNELYKHSKTRISINDRSAQKFWACIQINTKDWLLKLTFLKLKVTNVFNVFLYIPRIEVTINMNRQSRKQGLETLLDWYKYHESMQINEYYYIVPRG